MKKAIIPATVIVLSCSACNWNAWKGANIRVGSFDNKVLAKAGADLNNDNLKLVGTRGGFADVLNNTVYFDFDCSGDDVCMQVYVDVEFWENHEFGHVVDRQLGYPLGNDPIHWEMSAQCVAEVLTHRGPNFTQDGGYWDCPDQEVKRYRRLMVNAGMLDDQRDEMEQEANA